MRNVNFPSIHLRNIKKRAPAIATCWARSWVHGDECPQGAPRPVRTKMHEKTFPNSGLAAVTVAQVSRSSTVSQVTKQTHRPPERKEPQHFIGRNGVDSGFFPGQASFHESLGGGWWLGGSFWARVPCFGPLCQQHGSGRLVTGPGGGSCSGYWSTKGRTSAHCVVRATRARESLTPPHLAEGQGCQAGCPRHALD